MKNKGFTLVELLAVVTIFAILCVLAIPPILNQINNNKGTINDTNLEVIYKAVDLYIGTPKIGNTYCVSLQELVDRDLLTSSIKDMSTDEKYDLQRQVKLVIDDKGNRDYKLLEKGSVCNNVNTYPIL